MLKGHQESLELKVLKVHKGQVRVLKVLQGVKDHKVLRERLV